MDYKNRRKSPRYAFTVALTIFKDEKPIRCSECRNISQGGMCAVLSENSMVQGEVSVALSKMIDGNIINFEAECKVAWQDYSGSYDNARFIGLEFTAMDPVNVQNLETILAHTVNSNAALTN